VAKQNANKFATLIFKITLANADQFK